jgi:hypothetical protein
MCNRFLGVIGMLGLSLGLHATDVAVLNNGFSIRHERREVTGPVTRLYVNTDGSSYVDVPTSEIGHFETDLTPAQVSVKATADSANLSDLISDVSGRHHLDPDLVNSVIHAESGFNPHAVSRKGAQGLMQLMPQTASRLGVENAFDPGANVEGGSRYLRELLEHYNFDLIKALAAYNAGPQRVEQYRGVPPYYETQAYVARVIRDFNRKKIAERKAAAKGADLTKKHVPASATKSATMVNSADVTARIARVAAVAH